MLEKQIKDALQLATRLGASFADIRYKDIKFENLAVESGKVSGVSVESTRGFGVRVYTGGAMGFAASSSLDDIEAVVHQAYNIACASQALNGTPQYLAPKEVVQDAYASATMQDPFEMPLDVKLEHMLEIDAVMRETAGVSRTTVNFKFRKEEIIFADTDTSYIVQEFCQCDVSLAASAAFDNDMQTRSYCNVIRAGYEAVLELDLVRRAHTIALEAAELARAPECPSGVFDIILTPRQMFLQIHESVGHPTELDRVLGSEAAFAGRSFLRTSNLKDEPLIYGSSHVNFVADATCLRGLGTFAYDDEGVPAQNVKLVENGKFVAFQTSRDNAHIVGGTSTGAGIADGWANLPIVRMTNINMLPGDKTLDELIAGVEYGFIFDENKSWSIDDLRVNFQFACEIAHEIKDGKLTGRIFKNPIYSGKTTEFWASCDGVANQNFWELVGIPNCGKGQPLQVMRVSHGSSPSRFRNVKVGVLDA